jgi:hypothetical protein
MNLRFHKMRGIYWIEELLASQEGLCWSYGVYLGVPFHMGRLFIALCCVLFQSCKPQKLGDWKCHDPVLFTYWPHHLFLNWWEGLCSVGVIGIKVINFDEFLEKYYQIYLRYLNRVSAQ